MEFKQKVTHLIEKKGWTQDILAQKTGITLRTLQNYFKKNVLNTDDLEKIAEVLEVPVSYFFGETASTIRSEVSAGVGKGSKRFASQQEAENHIDYLTDKLSEKDKLIENLQRDKDFLQSLIKRE